jgi:serine phosphatase RsbU (regulator of sigma subunit)
MGFLFKPRVRPAAPAIEPVESSFPVLRDAEIGAVFAGEREAGDFYDSIRVSPNRVLFGLLDLAGRRDDNQTILADAQQVFREMGTDLLSPVEVNEPDALTQLCVQLNRTIMEAADGVHSCPAFAGCYNEDLGIVCYVNAGHTPGLVRKGQEISELAATGLPLGLFSHATCDAPLIALEPGAALLLASRGVVEAKCKDDEFGMNGLQNALQQAPLAKAHDLCAAILNQAQGFACTSAKEDDMTALALVRRPAA